MDRSAALTNLKARRTGQPSDDGSQPAVASTSGGQTAAPATKAITALAWLCDDCGRECAPIRTESRCMCGHRLREHDKPTAHGGGKCCVGKCGCRGFFYIVAEGSWILKCRCKHKHVEHDPVTHACAKPNCPCKAFDSPWVCNCDHPWAHHKQVVVEKQVMTLQGMMAAAAAEINPWDLINRGE